jgi:hypothetical protein
MTFRTDATIHRVEAGRLLEWRAHDRQRSARLPPGEAPTRSGSAPSRRRSELGPLVRSDGSSRPQGRGTVQATAQQCARSARSARGVGSPIRRGSAAPARHCQPPVVGTAWDYRGHWSPILAAGACQGGRA